MKFLDILRSFERLTEKPYAIINKWKKRERNPSIRECLIIPSFLFRKPIMTDLYKKIQKCHPNSMFIDSNRIVFSQKRYCFNEKHDVIFFDPLNCHGILVTKNKGYRNKCSLTSLIIGLRYKDEQINTHELLKQSKQLNHSGMHPCDLVNFMNMNYMIYNVTFVNNSTGKVLYYDFDHNIPKLYDIDNNVDSNKTIVINIALDHATIGILVNKNEYQQISYFRSDEESKIRLNILNNLTILNIFKLYRRISKDTHNFKWKKVTILKEIIRLVYGLNTKSE